MHMVGHTTGLYSYHSMPLQRGTGDRCSHAHRRAILLRRSETFSMRTSAYRSESWAGGKRKASAASEALAARAAAHRGLPEEEVARSPLCSLRQPPAGNGRWIRPAKGFSKRSASAGTHGDAGLDRQRAPDCTPRGSRGTSGNRRAEAAGQGGAGVARTDESKAPIQAGRGGMQKTRLAEPI